MAEAVLRSMLRRAQRPVKIELGSAGTHDYHVGRPAFPEAVRLARERGYDISSHVARRIAPGDFDRYDLILAMDRFNIANLRAMAPTSARHSIELLLEYGEDFHGEEVPDPYGGEVADFARAMRMIEDGCRGLVQVLAR
jgi:protein-tyrosine phosphatase